MKEVGIWHCCGPIAIKEECHARCILTPKEHHRMSERWGKAGELLGQLPAFMTRKETSL